MFKKLKAIYYRWRNRGVVPESCVYVVVHKPSEQDETFQRVVINSVHTTFKGAKKYLEKNHSTIIDSFRIMKYGLWTK